MKVRTIVQLVRPDGSIADILRTNGRPRSVAEDFKCGFVDWSLKDAIKKSGVALLRVMDAKDIANCVVVDEVTVDGLHWARA
tara:strand:+ start:412 stop:657 length:246 start_codon:yes stop_codon:yes gene_type:complete